MGAPLDEKGMLPCPFCGGNEIRLSPEIYSDDNPSEVIGPAGVQCDGCGAIIWGDMAEEAIAAWNRRPSTPYEELLSRQTQTEPEFAEALAKNRSTLYTDLSTVALPDELEVVARLRYEAGLVRAERNGFKEVTPRSRTMDEAADALSQAHSTIAALRAKLREVVEEREAWLEASIRQQKRARTAEAEVKRLTEEKEALEKALEQTNRRATDHQYMGWAYRSMLGEKGCAVAKMWDDKNVKRVHHSWGPEAVDMTGEERAQLLLDWEDAFAKAVPVEDIDSPDATLSSREKAE